MKKIIFFDADGTVWYPKKTKYQKHPVWVYKKYPDIHRAKRELTLVPGVTKTLQLLKEKQIKIVILSTNPHSPEKANKRVAVLLKHLGISHFFDEVHATRPYHDSKGEYIIEILKKYQIAKRHALMVGDSYVWDYKPAHERGIDAVLINHNYEQSRAGKVKRKIKEFKEILKFVS